MATGIILGDEAGRACPDVPKQHPAGLQSGRLSPAAPRPADARPHGAAVWAVNHTGTEVIGLLRSYLGLY